MPRIDTEDATMPEIAIVLADDYEDIEFHRPLDELVRSGHTGTVIGSRRGTVAGKRGGTADVALGVADADPARFDALLIPGGFSPDRLRTDCQVVGFVVAMVRAGKPVGAICHGPSLLIEADVVTGRTMTSFPSIRTDLINAGAFVVDEEVVIDDPLITSRDPDDLEAFCAAFLHRVDDWVAAHPRSGASS